MFVGNISSVKIKGRIKWQSLELSSQLEMMRDISNSPLSPFSIRFLAYHEISENVNGNAKRYATILLEVKRPNFDKSVSFDLKMDAVKTSSNRIFIKYSR